jgi:hypothetical protein
VFLPSFFRVSVVNPFGVGVERLKTDAGAPTRRPRVGCVLQEDQTFTATGWPVTLGSGATIRIP